MQADEQHIFSDQLVLLKQHVNPKSRQVQELQSVLQDTPAPRNLTPATFPAPSMKGRGPFTGRSRQLRGSRLELGQARLGMVMGPEAARARKAAIRSSSLAAAALALCAKLSAFTA